MKTPDPSDRCAPAGDGGCVVVAVCGGIAAYKVCGVVSTLVQRGIDVTVVMTEAATRFVGPVTFQALTARPVLVDLFDARLSDDPQHIHVTGRADLLLVAPATADMIAKAACGICDDLVSTMLVAARCPIVFAPSMNEAMWANKVVQSNVKRLEVLGYGLVGPVSGWMACRSTGMGRMAEADDIVGEILSLLESARGGGGSSVSSNRAD